MNDSEFYTQKGYQLNKTEGLSSSLEDYLEMICRLLKESDVVRINELAHKLNVKPSSASKMVHNLKELGYIDFQKYGYIVATNKGYEEGAYLLHRHYILNRFLCLLNGSESELSQVEKIEHFINKETVKNLEALIKEMEKKE